VSVIAPFLLLACAEPREAIEISFAVRYGEAGISCTDAVDGVWLSDLRFFVHDVRVLDESGQDLAFRMADDRRWQDGVVALIDLENGQGACENGSPDMNALLRGTLRRGSMNSVNFRLGIPAEQNHLDPMTAPPPRNSTAMHWHWLTGYKFVRAAVRTDTDGFSLHLGSSHCGGAPGTFLCQTPNRPSIALGAFDASRQQVILDVKKLFEGIDLKDSIASDCSSGPGQATCALPFRALGLGAPQPSDATPGTFRAEPIR
jgi:uncharacterized repeat protein (TIGR04052 family)